MGRIVVHENVTLDGVTQDPTGDEGFKFGGWFEQMSAGDREIWAGIEYQEALDTAAWLSGRRTHTWFAERWAQREGPWADRLRLIPKYVITSSPQDIAAWANSIALTGDVFDAAAKLRADIDGDVVVYGSGQLVPALLEHGLVDELRLMTHPFVIGEGKRLFDGSNASLQLTGMCKIGSSLALLTYQPTRVAGHVGG